MRFKEGLTITYSPHLNLYTRTLVSQKGKGTEMQGRKEQAQSHYKVVLFSLNSYSFHGTFCRTHVYFICLCSVCLLYTKECLWTSLFAVYGGVMGNTRNFTGQCSAASSELLNVASSQPAIKRLPQARKGRIFWPVRDPFL